jgi:hypothetical protein
VRTASEDRDWPGTALRVPGEGDFEEVLRRALRSAADGVEPTGDALTQIFRRAAAPWLVRQVSLLAADCVDLLRLIAIWLQPIVAWAMAVPAALGGWVHEAPRRLTSQAPAAAPIFSGQHRCGQARAAVSWGRSLALKARALARAAVARLRPALPVAVTAAVVMTGTVALSQTVARIELSGNRGAGTSALAGAAAATGDHRQSPQSDLTRPSLAQLTPARPGTTPASGGGATHQRSCAAMRCLPGPSGAPPSGPATTPSAQPTPSPSPSPAPTPAPTRSHHHPHQPHPHPSHHSHPPHPHPSHHSDLPHPGRAGTPGH